MGGDSRETPEGSVAILGDLVSFLMGIMLETLEEWHNTNKRTIDLEVCSGAVIIATKMLVQRFGSLEGHKETVQ